VLDFVYSRNDAVEIWVAKPYEGAMYVIANEEGVYSGLFVRVSAKILPEEVPLGEFDLFDLAQLACFDHYGKNPAEV